MKRLIMLSFVFNIAFGLDAEIVSDLPAQMHEEATKVDALTNVQSLLQAVEKAKSVQAQVSALKGLDDFSKDPATATDKVNNAVTGMLKDFNLRSGTSFTNLQDLIATLSSSLTSTGMMLKLQQSAGMQLDNISVSLQQIEAENQALIKYKQAEIALENKKHADFEARQKKDSDEFDQETQNINDAFHPN